MKNKKILFIIIIILCAIVFLIVFNKDIVKIFYPKKYEEIVDIYSEKYGVESNLIYAVIKAESDFNENAVSNKNALGLMQIMEDTAIEVANKYDIDIDENNAKEEIIKVNNNINIGTKYLSILLEKYENMGLALAAYNAGNGKVDDWIEKEIIKQDGSDIENIPYKETNNYVRKIIQSYKIYNELYDKN